MGQSVMARRPIGYAGKDVDRGQVFDLAGARNDEKLIRLGYLEAWKGKKTDLHECAVCGALFAGGNEREGHYEKRHVRLELTPDQEDNRAEREERFLNEVAPIYMEKTAA